MIQAIETVYNGYRFRSRLEARWAVFFDAAGIEYQYEPEGYKLSNGKIYLPDFYLPDFNIYAEIKADREHDNGLSGVFALEASDLTMVRYAEVYSSVMGSHQIMTCVSLLPVSVTMMAEANMTRTGARMAVYILDKKFMAFPRR